MDNTPGASTEFSKRVDDFLREYQDLTKKHQIDFAQFPMFVPDDKGGFRVVMQSTPVDLNLQDLNKGFIPK